MRRTIDTSKIVGQTEIAKFANTTPQAVNNWRARHKDFPKPLATLSCGGIYYLPDIKKWLKATERSS